MRTLFRKSFGSADSQSKLMWSESCKASASTGSDSNATDWLSFDPKEEQSDGTTDKSSKSTKADSSGTFDRNHRRHQCAFDVNNDRAFRRRFERITWQVLEGHTSDVNGVEFVGNRLLISCSNDKTVRVWRQNADERFAEAESSSTQPVQSPLNGHAYGVNAVRVSPFGTILTSASTDGRVILWSTQVWSRAHEVHRRHS